MIESILEEPLALSRHRTAPLLKEREQFLSHLLRQGTSPRRVRSIAAYLIHIVRLLELSNLRDVEGDEIGKAAECWANYRGPHRRRKAGKSAAACFSRVAKNWFRFHGRLASSRVSENPCCELVRDFTEYFAVDAGALTGHNSTIRFESWSLSEMADKPGQGAVLGLTPRGR
jgi:hypothetical protein